MSQFNLEQALAQWKKSLSKYEGFEQGTTEELFSHVSDAIDDLVNQGYTEEKAFHKVTKEKIGDLEGLSREYYKAKSVDASSHSGQSSYLATNFLKVAVRNIIKSRPHSYINLIGLALGLASIIVLSLYVFSELSFDKFHSDNQRIYRVLNKFVRGEAELTYPQAPPALAPALTSLFPEVELATRVRYADRPLIQHGAATYYEDHAFYADSSFFKIFDFELLRGNRSRVLNQPNSVVISESIANKYFGEDDPINKIVLMDGTGPLQITGVVKDVPHNSHFYFEMLISFQTYVVPDGYLANLQSWSWMGFLTYVKTHNGVDIPALEKKIINHYKASEERFAQQQMSVDLQPLNEIYLGSSSIGNPNNIFRMNSYTTIYSLIVVGFLIILIASFNYINLSIAMSMSRFKEIAMRKVLGSTKSKLILQFILESVLYTMLSLMIAIVLVMVGQTFLPQSIASKLFLDPASLLIYCLALVAFVILIGIVSGIFPALRLSSISSLELLKGTFKLKEGYTRNFLIGFQFALSAGLVAISLIIGQQIEFFSNKSLGFQKEGIVCINTGSDQVLGKTEGLQNQLKDNSNILSISQVSHIMGEGLSSSPLRLPGQDPEEAIQMNYFQTDYNFLPTLGLELVEGRYFSEDFSNDSTESIILNETAIKTLGLTEPLGKRVIFTGGTEREIIGVIKDFHFNSLHQVISPMAIMMPFTHVGQLAVRFQGENMYRTLSSIESVWKESFPNVPFEFQFVDDHLESLYEKETFFAGVIQFFTLLATGIACLGLYSLAAISLAGKVKQISIRRVLGAPIQSIVLLTGKNFLLLVVIATLLSWPLVWYVMNLWLSNFAYHIEISPWFFAITLGAILIITIVTISYHLFKAVTINPAETLRDN
ncbi:MAG: ABC transporter permease [Cyclobacteriaceae bacterium]